MLTCKVCETTIAKGFSYMTYSAINTQLESEESFHTIFWEAWQFEEGAMSRTEWNKEVVVRIKSADDTKEVLMDAWTPDDFELKFKRKPEAAGLKVVEDTHPVTGTKHKVVYAPSQQGPLWQLRTSVKFAAQHDIAMMPVQVY